MNSNNNDNNNNLNWKKKFKRRGEKPKLIKHKTKNNNVNDK